jgi:hypothetical protein
MDDRQPSFGLPSGITRNLANTTTPTDEQNHRGYAAALSAPADESGSDKLRKSAT